MTNIEELKEKGEPQIYTLNMGGISPYSIQCNQEIESATLNIGARKFKIFMDESGDLRLKPLDNKSIAVIVERT